MADLLNFMLCPTKAARNKVRMAVAFYAITAMEFFLTVQTFWRFRHGYFL